MLTSVSLTGQTIGSNYKALNHSISSLLLQGGTMPKKDKVLVLALANANAKREPAPKKKGK